MFKRVGRGLCHQLKHAPDRKNDTTKWVVLLLWRSHATLYLGSEDIQRVYSVRIAFSGNLRVFELKWRTALYPHMAAGSNFVGEGQSSAARSVNLYLAHLLHFFIFHDRVNYLLLPE